jgi:hypothetical protein
MPGIACLVFGRCSSVRLVLELALDYLGLGVTAGNLNPLDVLITGCQDCLQLRLEGVRLHFDIKPLNRANALYIIAKSRGAVIFVLHVE